jgi:hypothetical protein
VVAKHHVRPMVQYAAETFGDPTAVKLQVLLDQYAPPDPEHPPKGGEGGPGAGAGAASAGPGAGAEAGAGAKGGDATPGGAGGAGGPGGSEGGNPAAPVWELKTSDSGEVAAFLACMRIESQTPAALQKGLDSVAVLANDTVHRTPLMACADWVMDVMQRFHTDPEVVRVAPHPFPRAPHTHTSLDPLLRHPLLRPPAHTSS